MSMESKALPPSSESPTLAEDDATEEAPPVAGSMQIFVKTDLRTKPIHVLNSDTLAAVKAMVYADEGILTEHQKLFFAGEQLQDDQPFSHYDIQEGSTVFVVLGLQGGGRTARTEAQEDFRRRRLEFSERWPVDQKAWKDFLSQPLPVQELVVAKFGVDKRHPITPDKGYNYSALLMAYVGKIKRQWKQDQRDKDRASTKSQGRGAASGGFAGSAVARGATRSRSPRASTPRGSLALQAVVKAGSPAAGDQPKEAPTWCCCATFQLLAQKNNLIFDVTPTSHVKNADGLLCDDCVSTLDGDAKRFYMQWLRKVSKNGKKLAEAESLQLAMENHATPDTEEFWWPEEAGVFTPPEDAAVDAIVARPSAAEEVEEITPDDVATSAWTITSGATLLSSVSLRELLTAIAGEALKRAEANDEVSPD